LLFFRDMMLFIWTKAGRQEGPQPRSQAVKVKFCRGQGVLEGLPL
jgi:hypothetical protein